MLEVMQEKAFMIIAQVGTAKSMYMEALQVAKSGDYEQAMAMISEADSIFSEAHNLHFELIQKEAQGEQLPFSLMLMHAEDQLLTTDTLKLMIVEMIELYQKID